MLRCATLLLLLLLSAAPAAAGPPEGLILPIACTPGADCWVVRHVDHDPGPGARDYMCGALTGDGHKGTDIALRDLAVMAAGVEVRAAAAGVGEEQRPAYLAALAELATTGTIERR